MARKKILQELAEGVFANRFVASITGRIHNKAKRVYGKLAVQAANRYKKGDRLSEDSKLILKVHWSSKEVSKARNTTLALQEFAQKNPRGYTQLQEIMDKHRRVRRGNLTFGGELPEQRYVEIIQKLIPGIDYGQAEQFYHELHSLESSLGKRDESVISYLLPE